MVEGQRYFVDTVLILIALARFVVKPWAVMCIVVAKRETGCKQPTT